ncbi:MAG: hypothetical protein ACOYKM_01070 [Caulobacterales bacterium]
MTDAPEVTGLGLPHDLQSPLTPLIAGHVRRHAGLAPAPSIIDAGACFNDELFGLQNCALFQALEEKAKTDVRAACAAGVIEEAYFIEKAGLAYGARMLLAAQTTQERQMFALLTGDEATHLAWLAPFVPKARRQAAGSPFHRLIAELIETGPPRVLVYVLQVILEGWGLTHYRRLEGACSLAGLQDVLRAILKDEALHHKTGLTLLDAPRFNAAERAFTVEALAGFLTLVRVGPLAVTGAVAHGLGETGNAGLCALHQALDPDGVQTAANLALLRSLMQADGMGWAVEAAEGLGLFCPMPVREAVGFIA